MSSFRPLGQFVQYFLDNGEVNAGGSVTFYQTDLTTLKATYSDPGLTVLNANPVPLDADGRLSADVWGSGVYGAVLKDAGGVMIQTLNNVQSGADPGFTIPALVTGDFLTNDGSTLQWAAIKQVPDPTGVAGDILSTDGTLVFWQAVAALGIPVVTTGGSSITISGKKVIWGSGTLPASGSNTTNVALTFPDGGFSATPYHVGVTSQSGSGVTPAGGMPILSAINRTAAGFTCWGDTNGGFSSGSHLITATTSFTYFAIGPA